MMRRPWIATSPRPIRAIRFIWSPPAKEVDRPVWKHWLVIVVPDHVKTSTALLFINGGSNDRPAPTSASAPLGVAAVTTGSVVADLRGIPSEPLVFADENKRRSEDAI